MSARDYNDKHWVSSLQVHFHYSNTYRNTKTQTKQDNAKQQQQQRQKIKIVKMNKHIDTMRRMN